MIGTAEISEMLDSAEMSAMLDSMNDSGLCEKPLRGGWGTCKHDAGHRGRCSSVVFRCDACGKTRRGVPAAYSRDGEYVNGLAFCFLCARGWLDKGN